MIRLGFVLCALLMVGLAGADDVAPPVGDTPITSADAEVLMHNRLVTDDEIGEYFEFMIQSDAKALAAWHSLPPDERAARIAEYRSEYEESRTQIPVLRDLSPEERQKLEQWAPILAAIAASKDSARERLLAYSDNDYRAVIAAGIELIAARRNGSLQNRRHSSWAEIDKDFPQEIEFLEPELVRVMDASCKIFLHKGMGSGIGYEVRQQDDGRWIISSFDLYESWQHTEIKLGDE